MNSISIMGRLCADPKIKSTQDGTQVCNFTVAVPRPRSKDKTDFIKCVAWRGCAQFIADYFHKGKMIAVEGVLTTRSWKDDNDNSHSISEVLANQVYFCGDKSSEQPAEQPMDAEVYDNEIPF